MRRDCAVLLAPVVIMALLGVMQTLINNLLEADGSVRPADSVPLHFVFTFSPQIACIVRHPDAMRIGGCGPPPLQCQCLHRFLPQAVSLNMQCGCECTECTVTESDGTRTQSTDPQVCNRVFTDLSDANPPDISCDVRNKDNCAAEFSKVEQVQWCAIKQPSLWAPFFDLSNGVNYTRSDGSGPRDKKDENADGAGSPPGQPESSGNDSPSEQLDEDARDAEPLTGETKFMYTGSAFGEAAMSRFVRVPQLGC